MIIPINDEWRISTDVHQWKCDKFTGFDGKTGKELWVAQTFHSNFAQAKKALGQRMIRDLETETLEDAIEGVNQVKCDLENALEGYE